jgi:hypothetical protein
MGKPIKQRGGEADASKAPKAGDWEASKAPSSLRPGALFNARRRRKCGKALLWLVLPLGLAAAIAMLAAPEPEPHPVATAVKTSRASVDLDVGASMEAPPVDTWAKPEECAAWAGDGQCKASAHIQCLTLTLPMTRTARVATKRVVDSP